MTSFSLNRVGLAASVAGLMVVTAEAASAASPTSACPGEVSIGPTGNLIPAPAGMPLNCTQAFSDGTVNFAGGVTGYANDGFTTTTTIYDQTGGLVGVTNSVGDTIIVGPEHGVLSTVTDPSGHTTTFTYDSAGSVAQVIAPMSSTTRYTYDSDQRATQVTDPLGGVTTNAYDSEGRMTTSTDPAGVTTTNTYDSSTGRLTEQTETQGGMTIDTITYMYDTSGRLSEVDNSDGAKTTYTSYDGSGRLASETVTPPSGGLTTMITYDTDGNVMSVTESGGPTPTTTTYMYDTLDQLTKETETIDGGPDLITMYSYDSVGNLISVTDPEGDMTKFTYDAYGDVISMIDPSGTTSFAYFAVPEPSTWGTMLLGFAGLAFAGYRRAKRAAVVSV